MRRTQFVSLLAALLFPSCVIYDEALLDSAQADSVIVDGAGGTDVLSDGSGATGAVDDAAGGGATGGLSGVETSSGGGGTDVTGGTGGEDAGSSGGDDGMGSGGSDACDPPTGEKGEFTGVGPVELFDDFNNPWNLIGDGLTYDGSWIVSKDDAGTGIAPSTEAWAYDQDPCLSAGDTSLHITGTGYTTWGAGFDANLRLDGSTVSLSSYDGITFWARSGSGDRMRIALSDDDDTNGTSSIESSPVPLTSQWKQFKVPFPAANLEKILVIHLVVIAGDDFDLWIDDLSLYRNE